MNKPNRTLAVLIIEDQESDAQLLVRLLKKADYELVYEQVETAAQLRTALEKRTWDIIISDYKMPQFDGRTALILLQETGRDIPFIVVSGTIGEETAVSMLKAGAHDYLIKGDLARLVPAIKRELEQAEIRRGCKQAEEALAASEAELRVLFASMQDVTMVIDREGVYRKIAPTNPGFLFKPSVEMLGKNLREIFPADQAKTFIGAIQQVLDTNQTSQIEYKLLIDGRSVWFDASISPIDYDNTLWVARDVSARKQAEEALAASEAKLRALVEQVPAIVYTESADTRDTLYISPQVEKLTGYTPAEWTTDRHLWKKMIYPEDLAAVVDEDERTTITQEPFHIEYRILTRDGRTLWIHDESVLVNNQNGTPLFWQGVMSDITERKRIEEELRESETRYQLIFENSGTANTIFDTEYRVVLQNSLSKYLTQPADVLGKTALEIFGPEQGPIVTERMKRVLISDVSEVFETEFNMMPMGPKWMRSSYQPLRNKQHVVIGVQVISQDITERKRAEEALRESQSLYYSLVEVSPLSICRKDLEGRFTFANQRFLEVSHISLADLLGKTDFDLHPSELAEKFQRDEKIVLDTKRVWELIEERTLLNGDSSIVQSIKVPTYDGNGKINGVQTSFWDITERKRAEDQLRKLSRAVDQNPLSIVITDLQGKIEYVNPKFSQVTGYSFEESLGTNPRILKTGHTTREEYKILWDTILSGNVWQGEFLNKKKNGETYWEFATITPVFGEDGKITNFLALKENITERKQAEEAMKTTNILLEQTLEQSPIPMVLVSMPDGIIRSANSACRLFLGVDDEPSPVGTKLSELNISWQDLDMQGNPGSYDELPLPRSLMGLKTDPQERHVIRKDGTSVYELAYGSPIFDAAGNVIAGYLVMTDITERKRAEQDIHQRVMELETLNRISLVLRAVSKQEEMLSIVLDEALAILNTSHGSIELYNKTTGTLEKTITRGWITQITDKSQKSSEGIAGKVFTSGEIYISREFASDPESRAAARSQMLSGWGGVCVPVRTTQQTLGVLLVSVPSERELNRDEIRLLATLSEMTGAALQRMQLHEQTVRRLEQLHALRAVDQAIASNLDMRLTLSILLDQTISQLDVDAADVLLLPAGSSMLELAASQGFHSHLLGSIGLSDSFALRAIMEHRIISAADFEVSNQNLNFAKLWKEEGFVCYWCVPLIVKGEVKGILEVYCRKAFTPDPEWLDFFEALAGQAAITIDTAQLFENLQRVNLDLSLAYDATIEGWSRAMDLRDHETEGHTLRVTDLMMKLARAMRISEAQLTAIRRGALLHDIGKIGVPDAILLKEGKLTDEEWALMRRHPQLAHDMLAPISYLNDAIDIPYCHHEKWDGTGYPQGLKGERIPLIARIFAVVDVWDALTNDRTYRRKWTDQETIQYIKEQSGTHFDPQVVDVFLKHINIDA